jgi:hypothetical protein
MIRHFEEEVINSVLTLLLQQRNLKPSLADIGIAHFFKLQFLQQDLRFCGTMWLVSEVFWKGLVGFNQPTPNPMVPFLVTPLDHHRRRPWSLDSRKARHAILALP